MSEYQIELTDIFSGPMDLLLYLVRKEEVDVYDIAISDVAGQFIEYVDMLQVLDTDLAGDFLVMAATLMEIKSAMLLPKVDVEDEMDGAQADPRNELIRQLLEYKRFKDAAGILEIKAQGQMFRHKRPDGYIKRFEPDSEPELDMDQVSVWTLLETFDALLKATGNYRDYSVIKDETSIDQYEVDMLERLQSEGPLTFEHLFTKRKRSRAAMVGMFLAMLELIRDNLIWAEQSDDTQVIYLRALTEEPAEQAVSNAMMDRGNGTDTEAERAENPDDSES
ncbi:MAG: ScpA family protein [Phycisphaerae bacterium]|jgi:segregation and condensation protein A